jgi:hypothetical protein
MAWKFSVLVVANVTATSDELLAAMKRKLERGACDFTLLVPPTSGGREGREAAQTGLDAALARMRSEGLSVDGKIGDPDPVAAVHEIWDPMRFDEVLISTLPTGASRWLAVDLPHRVEKLTGVQVEHVVSEPPRPEVRTERVPRRESSGLLTPLTAITGKSTTPER